MSRPSLKQLENLTAIVGSVIVVVLLIARARYAGGLWRDECAALQLARMPGLEDIARNFQHEAFPLLFPAVIRLFTDFFGTSDAALRCFGLIVGIGLIAVSWFNARTIAGNVPLLFLTAVGLNTTVLTFGTSVRGYGLGGVLIVLVIGLVANLLVEPTPLRIMIATLVSVASVQCLLLNAALLFAINGSAGLVCLLRRDFKRAGIILGIGLVSGLSLIPYLRSYESARSWNIVVKSPVSLARVWHQFFLVLGSPRPAIAWVWLILGAALVAAAFWRLSLARTGMPPGRRDQLLFVVLVLLSSLVASYVFLQTLGYVPQPWYFITVICVTAMAADFLAAFLRNFTWLRISRLCIAIVALVILPVAAWPKVTQRQTNSDIAARELEQSASPNDLIVVSPWQFGIPFSWYYHGPTPWVTLPAISEHRIHRYDLVKDKMMSPEPIDDVLDLIASALRAGNQVWFVGGLQFPSPGQPPISLPPAPGSKFGWDNFAYMAAWQQQMGAFVRAHGLRGRPVKLPTNGFVVSGMEDAPLLVVQGWKE